MTRTMTRARLRAVRTPKHLKGIEHLAFRGLLREWGLPAPVGEVTFALDTADPRRFRFDYAWPDVKLAVECDGGVWSGGAHGRGSGILRDMEKQNLAVLNGWRVLRLTPSQLVHPEWVELVRRALNQSPQSPER